VKEDILKSNVLSTRIIPNVQPELAAALELPDHIKSLAIITADCDDVTYVALDEATKTADVEVVYGKSMYAGAGNASTKLAGEVIGILGGPSPAEVKSGLERCVEVIEQEAHFISANEDDSIVYFAHTISRTGSYLSKVAGIQEGLAIAYLIAPPLESVFGLDAAMKAADVDMGILYGPPSETNFGGGLLTGSQSACKAACDAFANAVKQIAADPKEN